MYRKRDKYSMTSNVFLTRYKMMPDFPAYYRVDYAWLALFYALLVYLICTVHVFCVNYHFHPPGINTALRKKKKKALF